MDWKKLIGDALKRKAAIEQQRAGFRAEQRTMAEGLGENESFSAEQRTKFDELGEQVRTATDQLDAITAEITGYEREQSDDDRIIRAAQERHPGADAPEGGTQAGRTNERDTTYSRDKSNKGVSFFRDMLSSQSGMPSQSVQERLLKHEQETIQLVRDGKLSERAIATTGLGGLVPPQYLADQYATIARAGRPTANLVKSLPLADTGMSIVIPRGTTGVATGVQATQNTNVASQDAAVTDITVPVVTIAGQVDPSRQSIERGIGVDEILFADLAAAYAVNVDVEVLSGTGTGGRALGILNTAGISQATAFGAAATVATFYSKVAGGINSVQSGRFLPPEAIVMHPRRWAWLTAQMDSSGRPLVLPTANGPMNIVAVTDTDGGLTAVTAVTPSGELQALPVITDASIPTAVGTGPEDQVIVSRFSDHLLWEDGGGAPTQLRFEQTLGNQLTVKLVAYGYIAFTAARFPLSTAVIGGNAAAGFGLVAPTF